MSVPFEERFWSKVEKTPSCWIWVGANSSHGYGTVRGRDGKAVRAHRASWEIEHGEAPPDGLFVCHRCDVRACVRPDHLFLGTAADNTQDMMAKGRHRAVQLRGGDHPASRLSEHAVREMRRLHHAGWLQREIAAAFGVHKSTVQAIVTGRNWGWLA